MASGQYLRLLVQNDVDWDSQQQTEPRQNLSLRSQSDH